MYLNRILIAGNAAADPEVRDLNGRKGASFRVGITEKYKDNNDQWQEKTEWVNVVAWGKTAEVAERYIKKGSSVLVEGKIQTREWKDRDGNKRFTTEVLASNIQVDRSRSSRASSMQDSDNYDF